MATFSNLINCIRNYSTESHSRAQDFEFNVKLNQETFSDLRNFIDEAIESKESCPIAQTGPALRQRGGCSTCSYNRPPNGSTRLRRLWLDW